MQLLIVRHGVAEERAAPGHGVPDARRQLTPEGRRRMRKAARGLALIVGRVDIVATSPLVRARQTAEILREVVGGESLVERRELAPHRAPAALAAWLAEQPADACVAVVGHEPHLSLLLTWLICGRGPSRFLLKKGAAALVDVPIPPRAGAGVLVWLLQPQHLRGLAR